MKTADVMTKVRRTFDYKVDNGKLRIYKVYGDVTDTEDLKNAVEFLANKEGVESALLSL